MRAYLPSQVAAGVIAITGTLACDSKTGPTTEPVVVAVELSGTLTVAPGATTQLTLTAVKNDGSRSDITSTAQWSAFGSNNVTSLGQGRFLGRTVGDSIITGREGRASASREMIVVPDGTYRLNGRVTANEAPFNGLAGAQIRARDGQGAGPSAVSDADGYYRLYGVGAETDLIVTRAGYLETTQHVRIDKHTAVNIALGLAGPRLAVAGTYTATFDWSPCPASFRDDLRRRVYSADIAEARGRVFVRFTSPAFAMVNGVPGNLMDGGADAISVVIATPTGTDQGFYGPPSYPVIEILPDDTRLVLFVTATLSPTAAGFAGPLTGEATHYGRRYPLDPQLGSCSAGTLTLERQ